MCVWAKLRGTQITMLSTERTSSSLQSCYLSLVLRSTHSLGRSVLFHFEIEICILFEMDFRCTLQAMPWSWRIWCLRMTFWTSKQTHRCPCQCRKLLRETSVTVSWSAWKDLQPISYKPRLLSLLTVVQIAKGDYDLQIPLTVLIWLALLLSYLPVQPVSHYTLTVHCVPLWRNE